MLKKTIYVNFDFNDFNFVSVFKFHDLSCTRINVDTLGGKFIIKGSILNILGQFWMQNKHGKDII